MTKQEAMVTIRNELGGFADAQLRHRYAALGLDGALLDTALEVFGHGSIQCDGEYALALDLTAALEFFGGEKDFLFRTDLTLEEFADALDKAATIVARDQYVFFEDVYTCEDLGREVVLDEMGGQFLPDLILDYLDVEALGEDYERDTHGKFTHYGFFAPTLI